MLNKSKAQFPIVAGQTSVMKPRYDLVVGELTWQLQPRLGSVCTA